MKKALNLITAVLLLAAVISCNGENAFRQEDAVCSVGSRHFASVQSAVDYVTSTTSRAVSEENTIRLLKDILGTNTPEAQRGSIVIPKDYSGSLLIDLSGYSYEFAGSSFISVNGGKDVTVTNGKLIVPSDNSSTGKVLTVSQGELNIKDVIVDDSRPTPLAADVKKNAKLNISATDDKLSSLNGSFTFSLGASMSVNGGTVTFMAIEEPDVKADISLYKGVIKNSHDVNDRITEAVRNPEIERSIVHTPLEKNSAKNATCTEDGVKEHYVCKTCNGYFLDAECTKPTTAAETVITKLGHRDGIRFVALKNPTCTESGNNPYFICSYCQMTFSDSEGKTPAPEKIILDALGHDLKYVSEKASTCKKQGYDAFYGCTRCERIFSDADANNEIKELTLKPLNPNNHVKTIYTNESGTQHTLKCDDCSKEIRTEGHTYGDWVDLGNGYYRKECICDSYQEALGHYFIDQPEIPPNCTREGSKAYARCEIHKDEIWDTAHQNILTGEALSNLIIGKLQHEYNGYQYSGDAHWQVCTNCESPTDGILHSISTVSLGSSGHRKRCEICGFFAGTTEPHIMSKWTAVGGEAGKAVRTCTSIGCDYSMNNDGYSFEHVAEKIGSCTEDSNPSYWIYSGEGEEFYFNEDQTEVIIDPVTKATGHDNSEIAGFPPGCTTPGKKPHYKCSNCNALFSDYEGLNPVTESDLIISPSHIWSSEKYESDDSGHYRVCSECGVKDSVRQDHILGSRWQITSTPFVAMNICSECDHTVYTNENDIVKNKPKKQGCTTSGSLGYGYLPKYSIYFSYDGLNFVEYEDTVLQPTGHDWGSWQSDYFQHWIECKNCFEIKDKTKYDHLLSDKFRYDNVYHWQYCTECGYEKNQARHNMVTHNDEFGNQYEECENCHKKNP